MTLHGGPSSPTEVEAVVSGMKGGEGGVGFPGTSRVLETRKDSAREMRRACSLATVWRFQTCLAVPPLNRPRARLVVSGCPNSAVGCRGQEHWFWRHTANLQILALLLTSYEKALHLSFPTCKMGMLKLHRASAGMNNQT